MLVIPDKKWCPDCNQLLSLDRFYATQKARLGRSTYCRPCAAQRVLVSHRSKVAADPLFHVKRHLWSKYRLRPHDIDAMFSHQEGLCWLCELPLTTDTRVDHDHACCPGRRVVCGGGCIRGLAHDKCNVGIGAFQDSPMLLERAAKNLLRWAA